MDDLFSNDQIDSVDVLDDIDYDQWSPSPPEFEGIGTWDFTNENSAESPNIDDDLQPTSSTNIPEKCFQNCENSMSKIDKRPRSPVQYGHKKKVSKICGTPAKNARGQVNMTPKKTRKKWTDDEDVVLMDKIQRYQLFGAKIKWTEVSKYLCGRTARSCATRYVTLKSQKNPDRRRGKWSKDEDMMLTRVVQRFGESDWKIISLYVRTRDEQQCRYHWTEHLDPKYLHTPWTEQEKNILKDVFSRDGKRFRRQHYQQYLPHRTTEQIGRMLRRLKL